MYEYQAKVIKVVDADTYELEIDLGFNITITHRVRLLGVDAFETKLIRGNTAEEVELGQKIKEIMHEMLTDKDVLIHTVKDRSDKYGRYLVDMYQGDLYVNNYVKNSGMAK